MSAMALSAAMFAGSTHAATIPVVLDFESSVVSPFTLTDQAPPVGPGNCRDGSCIKVNKNGTDTLAIDAPLTFSISSFWFQLLGKGDDLLVTTDKGVFTLLESVFDHNNGHTADASSLSVAEFAALQGITYISFVMGTNGSGRVDDINLSYDDGREEPSPVPLPAAGLMLAGALGGLSALRRRKTAA
jgi:hypothetical protein